MENLIREIQGGELKVIGTIDRRRTVAVGRARKLAVGIRVTRSDEDLVRGLVIYGRGRRRIDFVAAGRHVAVERAVQLHVDGGLGGQIAPITEAAGSSRQAPIRWVRTAAVPQVAGKVREAGHHVSRRGGYGDLVIIRIQRQWIVVVLAVQVLHLDAGGQICDAEVLQSLANGIFVQAQARNIIARRIQDVVLSKAFQTPLGGDVDVDGRAYVVFRLENQLRGCRQVLKLDHALFMAILQKTIDGSHQLPLETAVEQFLVVIQIGKIVIVEMAEFGRPEELLFVEEIGALDAGARIEEGIGKGRAIFADGRSAALG